MKIIEITCNNCNGTGYIAHYDYHCQGICFKCNGTGKIKEKQYTESELKKKEEKIKAKHQSTLKELRGFKNTDILYLIDQENTYSLKNQIKNDGAIWNMYFRKWSFENDNLKDKYNLISVNFYDTIKEGINYEK